MQQSPLWRRHVQRWSSGTSRVLICVAFKDDQPRTGLFFSLGSAVIPILIAEGGGGGGLLTINYSRRGIIQRVPAYLSLRRNLVLPPPIPKASVSPLWTQGGEEQHSWRGEGVGGTRFRRLVRKPGTLYVQYTLCFYPREPSAIPGREKIIWHSL